MIGDSMTLEEARILLSQIDDVNRASIALGKGSSRSEVHVETLDLSTARTIGDPKKVPVPFRSVFVIASDSDATVNMRVETVDSFQGDIPLKDRDAPVFPRALGGCFLTWEAQAGKTMTLLFFASGEFRSGSFSNRITGGVTLSDGDAVANSLATVATTVGTLFAASSTRKKVMILNYGASDIYVGDSSTTTDTGLKPGIRIAPGGFYEWQSAAACSAIADGAANANIALVTFS